MLKLNKKTLTLVLGFSLLFTTVSLGIQVSGNSITPTGISTNVLTPQGSISCSGDTDCDTVLGAFGGSGLANDPYIIENFAITGSISLQHTSKFVTIRFNSINSAGSAIYLNNISSHIVIEKNNMTSSSASAVIASMIHDSVTIKHNNFSQTLNWAVFIGDDNVGLDKRVNHLYVYNNTFTNVQRGMLVYQTNTSVIYNNTFSNIQTYSLEVGAGNETHIYDNIIKNSGSGLRINFFKKVIVENNTLFNLSSPGNPAVYEYAFNDAILSNRTYSNNTIHDIGSSAFVLNSFVSVRNNTLYNLPNSGIYSGLNSTIAGNSISNFSTSNIINSDAIIVNANSSVSENHIANGAADAIVITSNSSVMDNVINDVIGYGVDARNAEDVLIAENTIYHTAFNSIIVFKDTVVNNNDIAYSLQNAIYVGGGGGNTVRGNTIRHSGGSGIFLDQTISAVVDGNSITNSTVFSIYSVSSPTSTLTNNILTDSIGLDHINSNLAAYQGYTISGNTVNGLPLGYFEAQTTNITGSYGQIIIVDSQDIAVVSVGISNSKIPITIIFSSGITLDSVTLTNSELYGIRKIGYSGILYITDCSIMNTMGNGIIAQGSLMIEGSEISGSTGDGVRLENSVTIFGSIISDNGGVGIRIEGSGSIVTDNVFEDNTDYAIVLGLNSGQNYIHHNNFINNHGGSNQAYDNGSSNYWYEAATYEGNYWSDYSGSGAYPISSPGFKEDQYPFANPIVFPRIIETTTTSNTPTTSEGASSTPSDEFSDTKAGFLYSPINFGVLIMLSSIVMITRKVKRIPNRG